MRTKAVKAVRILSLHRAVKPRNHVLVYATVESRSRGTRLNHSVVKVGRAFRCSCEHNILGNARCAHIKAVSARLRRGSR